MTWVPEDDDVSMRYGGMTNGHPRADGCLALLLATTIIVVFFGILWLL